MIGQKLFLFGGWILAAVANLALLVLNLHFIRRADKRMDEIDEMQDYLRRSHQHLHVVDSEPKRTRGDPGPGAA